MGSISLDIVRLTIDCLRVDVFSFSFHRPAAARKVVSGSIRDPSRDPSRDLSRRVSEGPLAVQGFIVLGLRWLQSGC